LYSLFIKLYAVLSYTLFIKLSAVLSYILNI
jgi:hypothetical protein